jgi:hypothetical protein
MSTETGLDLMPVDGEPVAPDVDERAQQLLDEWLTPYANADAELQWEAVLRLAVAASLMRSRAGVRALERMSTWYLPDQGGDYLRWLSSKITEIADATDKREASIAELVRLQGSAQPEPAGHEAVLRIVIDAGQRSGSVVRETTFQADAEGRLTGKVETETRT